MGFSFAAPLAGRDQGLLRNSKRRLHFNPRAPCGARHDLCTGRQTGLNDFNPRTPCGVRRGVSIVAVVGRAFQSTHPLRGATLCPCAFTCLLLHFNPRAPCGVRRKEFQDYSKRFHDISIHAPLAGRDALRPQPRAGAPQFQSTRPLRGATNVPRKQVLHDKISIHAPLAGRDKARD